MLEARIEELTRAVERLTAALEAAHLNPAQRQAVESVAASAAVMDDSADDLPGDFDKKAEAEPEPEKQPEPDSEPQPEVTHKELRQLCLQVVRRDIDRNKPLIKQAIRKHGDGAEVVEEVPLERLPALKADLEAI